MFFDNIFTRVQHYWEMDDIKSQENRTNKSPLSSPGRNPSSRHSKQQPAVTEKKVKHVQYSNVCSVVLIPTRHEFRDAGLDLWYRRGEYDYGSSDDERD